MKLDQLRNLWIKAEVELEAEQNDPQENVLAKGADKMPIQLEREDLQEMMAQANLHFNADF